MLSSRLDLSPKVRPSDAHFRPGLLCGKERMKGKGGWWSERGFIFPRYSDTIVKPPTSPVVRGTEWSEAAARFLISFLIPPDPIHPGPACRNPSVRYPPMFNMLMPTSKWMNHHGTQARHHFKKDRCINTPENPCLLLDNRLSINGPVNRCVCAEPRIPFPTTDHLSHAVKKTPHVWGCTNCMLPPQRPNIKEAFVCLICHQRHWIHFFFSQIMISFSAPQCPT